MNVITKRAFCENIRIKRERFYFHFKKLLKTVRKVGECVLAHEKTF